MLTVEYRIPLPFKLEEYQVGQLYAVMLASQAETSDGEGVQVLTNERYENADGERGWFTHKIYHISSKLPSILRLLAPAGATEVHEKSWNSFPKCKTVMTSSYFQDAFKITIESRHEPGYYGNIKKTGSQSSLMKRKSPFHQRKHGEKIVEIDILKCDNNEIKKFVSTKFPERTDSKASDWALSTTPMMTCFKRVSVECKIFGVQRQVENTLQTELKSRFTNLHTEMYLTMEKWLNLDLDGVRRMEIEAGEELNKKLKVKAAVQVLKTNEI